MIDEAPRNDHGQHTAEQALKRQGCRLLAAQEDCRIGRRNRQRLEKGNPAARMRRNGLFWLAMGHYSGPALGISPCSIVVCSHTTRSHTLAHGTYSEAQHVAAVRSVAALRT